MRREEEEEDMGSTLVGPTIEDVDDVSLPPPSVAIDIDGGGGGGSTTSSQVTHADLLALEERVNLLLAATSREQSVVNARLDALHQLDLAATLASAARDCAAAAKAAVEILEGAKEAVDLLASDEFVQEQLEKPRKECGDCDSRNRGKCKCSGRRRRRRRRETRHGREEAVIVCRACAS